MFSYKWWKGQLRIPVVNTCVHTLDGASRYTPAPGGAKTRER